MIYKFEGTKYYLETEVQNLKSSVKTTGKQFKGFEDYWNKHLITEEFRTDLLLKLSLPALIRITGAEEPDIDWIDRLLYPAGTVLSIYAWLDIFMELIRYTGNDVAILRNMDTADKVINFYCSEFCQKA